jgi:hypothetical protein
VTRRHRQLQTRSSLLLLRSVILGNGDGLRVETNARSGNVFFALLTRSLKTCLCTRLLSSFFFCLLTRSYGSNISSCNMLEITCILRTHFFYFFTFFFLLPPPFCSCAPEFAVCPCFIASYLSTLYVSYIPPGAWCATKLL